MTTAAAEAEPKPITDRQREVYDCIVDHCERRGYSPTIREIGVALGIKSTNGVVCHLRPLVRKGWISWTEGRARTIRPIGGLK